MMKNYDKKVKQTRILLSDYLLLKGFAQKAGISMSEALHEIIAEQSKGDPAQFTMFEVMTCPVIIPNGSKPLYSRTRPELRFEVKAKGVIDGQG